MLRKFLALTIVFFLASCTSPPKTPNHEKSAQDAAGLSLDAQAVINNCLSPHEVFTFPPQPMPGIPAILSRHAECMGSTNVVVVIWPGAPNRITLLYVQMLVESYVQHPRKTNEHYNANLVAVDTVNLEEDEPAQTSEMITSAAVFKLVHVQEKDKK
jgi:hypothetical protein